MTHTDVLATVDMVALCFHTLINHLNGVHAPTDDLDPLQSAQVGGMFVTWETTQGGLRGCIGSLSELPLSRLTEYAIRSSQQDSRFHPIRMHELPNLACHVSILHSFENCHTPHSWTVGLHGIIVEFEMHSRSFRATFLPNVMPEQGWSVDEALSQAVRKTGFRGNFAEIISVIRVTRYQSSKASLTYSEFQRLSRLN
jgi:uncharacterized protein (TIGR00296 family)